MGELTQAEAIKIGAIAAILINWHIGNMARLSGPIWNLKLRAIAKGKKGDRAKLFAPGRVERRYAALKNWMISRT